MGPTKNTVEDETTHIFQICSNRNNYLWFQDCAHILNAVRAAIQSKLLTLLENMARGQP